MNLVPKMHLIWVEKSHFKNTQVLKKNIFVVLGHVITYFTSLLERTQRSDGAQFGTLFFWSGATERSSIFGAER